MAIFQKAYQGYSGPLTKPMDRTWVIFRYALADVFQSRLFLAFFAVCFLLPILLMCFLYLFYNLEFLIEMDVDLEELTEIDGNFFLLAMQYPQNFMLFVMIMAIGPAMISPDIRNNAMPLFLSRPINKASYILGKLLVLLVLGSLISWVPALPLFFWQGYLAGGGWLGDNLHLIVASVVTSMAWILSLSLLSFAVSAWVEWKTVARLAFFGILFFSSIFGGVVTEIFGGWGGYMVNIYAGIEVIMRELYRADSNLLDWMADMQIGYALLQFFLLSVISLFVLTRRIRAFQVVS
ncbi:MAG: hypothetical protein COB20_05900 [SAR86 cluster bacterium]|uniref:Uncharacterized protein n=1 Tax=SAR86 cluster bacterium TaxID=2030880 RepID=A0A2A4X8L4_9GAMM|nr:MAG: hypothetical protein COB20_05900 [SAR86 cluster bacterium]